MSNTNKMTRRQFLKGTAAAAAAAAFPLVIPSSALGDRDRPAPSDRIAMGFVGLGGQGTGDMGRIPGQQASARRGPSATWTKGNRDRAKGIIDKRNADQGCKAVSDFRDSLQA